MPLSFDPAASVWVCLQSDEAKTRESRPEFAVRVLTVREVDAWADRLLAIRDGEADRLPAAIDLLMSKIVNWRNFGRDFSREAMIDVLTLAEIWELAYNLPDMVGLGEIDLKKSASQSQSAGAQSAAAAGTPAATAPASGARC